MIQTETSAKTFVEHNKIRIGILGAGPAGLMTALALEHYIPDEKFSITILDRNASDTDYPGVEYGIQARACRALERINQLEPALRRGNPCSEIAFYNARLKKHFKSIKSDPKYTRCVVRQEFLVDLASLLQHTKIKRRHHVDSVTPLTDGTVKVEGLHAADDERFAESFDLLVAADGVHSVVRKSLFPAAAVVHDRGFSCIYMLVEGGLTNASPGFLARANSGRSELIMGSISTMTMFPLGKGRLALGIGFDHETKSKLWQEHGLPCDTEWASISAEKKKAIAVQLTSDTDRENGNLVKALDLIPDWNSYKIYNWAMRDTDPLPKPYVDSANIIAIGDAAHAIMPTIGMGASLAIEDAEILAARIASLAKRTDDPKEFRTLLETQVFSPFTRTRYPVWHELVGRARAAAIGNFIRVGNRRRFSIGPQIPNNSFSRIVSSIEWLAEKLGH
jgi:salicylate hydroxylase